MKKIFLLVLALILASPLLVSVLRSDGSMLINGSGDNLWHLSLAIETQKQIPPTFPGMNGVPLKNYHYFSDLVWGTLSKITNISISTMYFQIGAVIVCFLLVYLVYKLAFYYSKNTNWSIVCVITTLFVGSAAFVKPLFIKDAVWSGNNFMLDQPYDQLINLHTGIGYILIILGTILVFKWLRTGNLKYSFYAALVFSILFGIKIFFAIPMAIAFGIICLVQIKDTKFKSILPAFLLFVLSILIYYLISDKSSLNHNSPITLRPGWLLTKMIEDPDRFKLDGYYLKQLHYESKNNWLRLTQMEIEKIFMYLLGNFWIKLLGVVYLIKSFKKYPKENIFLSLCIIISLILPLLVTPEPDPFNTIQFGQVAIIFLGLLLGLFASQSKKNTIILALFTPIIIFSFYTSFFNPKKFNEYIIPKEEISALQYLKNNSETNAVVMVDPLFDNKKMKVTAFAERRTFYTGDNISWLFNIVDDGRSKTQTSFFSPDTDDKFIRETIKDYSIDYIYSSSPMNFEKQGYPLVYSNPQVYIFKTKLN